MVKVIRDTRLMFVRSVVNSLRNPMWLFIGLFQPVLYLLLFAPLLDSLTMPGFESQNSLDYFVPGLLVLTGLFGVAFAGFNILEDLQNGMVERLRVTPATRTGMLLGMVLRDTMLFGVQCVLLVGIAVIMGFRPDAVGTAMLMVFMLLMGLMVASFSYGIALIVKDQGALAGSLSTLTLPLLLLSGVMLPLTLAPDWMKTLADLNPFAYAVDATRLMADGNLGDSTIYVSFVIMGVLASLTVLWASRIFHKAVA
jgi:ABC-2 type transport system permease protein